MRISDASLFERIIENTPFSEAELVLLILTGPTRYKDHWINKRHGRGKRLISQPTAELKLVQRWLVSSELSSLPVDVHATAYRKGLSIRDHVSPHTRSHFLLKLDFKDFFPSLTDSALRYRLEHDANYTELEVLILTKLLFRKKQSEETYRLSIGAPSSPFISNYLLLDFDRRLADYCESNYLHYTRYADDIAISVNRAGTLDFAKVFVERLISELPYLGLRLNEEKTVNVSKKFRRQLVGLVISNQGKVSLGREEKRRLRAAVHSLALGKLDVRQSVQLRGQLAFCLSIDRDFVITLCNRHGFQRVCDLPSGSDAS
ncbi:retron St85 family RNA-directed DNA polymerase [Nitrosospira briensis]|uniref:retron St85 family RNA-directed DNA polymerase n=1 Tax=Nitrosospira briensis TaxID=35799 RepID=UPI00046AA863|nr:retron St85 family RNA-directed DNA polymerase [Nitrosospira briensis]